MPFAQKHIGFEKPPRLFLKQDPTNAKDPLGKTAYYDPAEMSVTRQTDAHFEELNARGNGHVGRIEQATRTRQVSVDGIQRWHSKSRCARAWSGRRGR